MKSSFGFECLGQQSNTSAAGKRKQRPAVSVLIPTYNRIDYLGRAIRSVLKQTFQDFELIIVDDGSTDNTEKVVRDFNDARILYLTGEGNSGAATARNKGIRMARGEHIAFLDSDDEWFPDKLEKQVAKFISVGRSTGLVYTHLLLKDFRTGAMLRGTNVSHEGHVHEFLLRNDFIGSCSSVMVRRDVVKRVGGFDERLPSRQDWDLWMRIAREYPVACVPFPLLICNIGHSERISGTLKKILEGTMLVLNKHSDHMKKSPQAYGKHLAAVAQIELNYKSRHGWRTAFKALRVYPVQPKLLAALWFSLFGKTVYRKIFLEWGKLRGDFYVGQASL